jgi:hypothetical protein
MIVKKTLSIIIGISFFLLSRNFLLIAEEKFITPFLKRYIHRDQEIFDDISLGIFATPLIAISFLSIFIGILIYRWPVDHKFMKISIINFLTTISIGFSYSVFLTLSVWSQSSLVAIISFFAFASISIHIVNWMNKQYKKVLK